MKFALYYVIEGMMTTARRKWSEEEVAAYRKEKMAGFFYFNLKDSNILVPKNLGAGWTFNFGHPVAWIAVALVAAFLIWRLLP